MNYFWLCSIILYLCKLSVGPVCTSGAHAEGIRWEVTIRGSHCRYLHFLFFPLSFCSSHVFLSPFLYVSPFLLFFLFPVSSLPSYYTFYTVKQYFFSKVRKRKQQSWKPVLGIKKWLCIVSCWQSFMFTWSSFTSIYSWMNFIAHLIQYTTH